MPSFRSTRPVRHSPAQMFDLVADVETYPEFLPLCEGLRVMRRTQSGEGVETLVAAMERRLQGHPRELHDPRHPRPPAPAHPRRVCRRPVQVPREPLDLQADPDRVRGRVLHRLRVPQPAPSACSWAPCSTRRSGASWRPSRSGPTRSTAARRRRARDGGVPALPAAIEGGLTRSTVAPRRRVIAVRGAPGFLQQPERIRDGAQPHGRAAEIAVAALDMARRASGDRDAEMDEADRLRRRRAAGSRDARDGDRDRRRGSGPTPPPPSRAPPLAHRAVRGDQIAAPRRRGRSSPRWSRSRTRARPPPTSRRSRSAARRRGRPCRTRRWRSSSPAPRRPVSGRRRGP